MAFSVDVERCSGCGRCVTACPNEAICLLAGKAIIESSCCGACGACAALCPNEAIRLAVDPVEKALQVLPQASTQAVPFHIESPQPSPLTRSAWLNMAFSFFGREVAPRLVDLLIASLAHRLERPAAAVLPADLPPSRGDNVPEKRRRNQRQARYQGGRRRDFSKGKQHF
ncbi:MAG: 4Fe-4S binding protein [Chloroflexota bacterium]